MSDFVSSRGGRLFLFALGLMLCAGGAALLGAGVPAVALAGAALLSAYLCALIAALLAAREFPRQAALAFVSLPALTLLAWLARGVFSRLGDAFAYTLLALGLLAAATIFRGAAGDEAVDQTR
jgi:hypothetical protein